MSIDLKEVGIALGVILTMLSIIKWVFFPRIEKAIRTVLEPDLKQLSEAVKSATACAEELEELVIVIKSLDEEMTEVFKIMRLHRDLLADLNELTPLIAGADRRQEDPRRRVPELPQLPERRRIYRRKGDRGDV